MLPMLGVFAVLMVALFVGSLDESVVGRMVRRAALAAVPGTAGPVLRDMRRAHRGDHGGQRGHLHAHLYADGTVTCTSSRICPPRRRGYRPVGANASRYATMSRSRPIAAFAGLVRWQPHVRHRDPRPVPATAYTTADTAASPWRRSWPPTAMREPRISGTGSFGTALAIDASEAPVDIAFGDDIPHSAMPCRNANRAPGIRAYRPAHPPDRSDRRTPAAITGQEPVARVHVIERRLPRISGWAIEPSTSTRDSASPHRGRTRAPQCSVITAIVIAWIRVRGTRRGGSGRPRCGPGGAGRRAESIELERRI